MIVFARCKLASVSSCIVRKKNNTTREVRLAAETEITTMVAESQVVIPQSVREKLSLSLTELISYGRGDIIMKKIQLPDWEKRAEENRRDY